MLTSLAQARIALMVPLVVAIAACASPAPIDPSSLPTTPAAFKENDPRWTTVTPAEAQPRGMWWKAFSDPELDRLVEQAGRNNTNIQVAAARLALSRSLVRSARADRSPQVDASTSVVREKDPRNGTTTPGTLIRVGADLSYEVDLFGRLKQASNAAALDASASEALLQSTRLLVQANVAQTYFQLRALDVERYLVRETVTAHRETLRLTESRHRAGDAAELDVVRVTSEAAATESEALALDRQRALLEHALAVLVGAVVADFQLEPAEWTTSLPVIPAGVPSTVLARRPDVSAAQRSMTAAQARVGVAQAAWLPDLFLTGAAGYASPELGDLFKWSARTWGIGALASLPIFDGGRRAARVEGANAELDGALATYREQILVAFRDVEDQLASLRLLGDQAQVQARAVAAAGRATLLSDARYRNGYVSQIELLDARRSELRNRREALQVRSAQYQATVALVRALGGGWGEQSTQQ
jgi:multidrug efflux system outer membrane protein